MGRWTKERIRKQSGNGPDVGDVVRERLRGVPFLWPDDPAVLVEFD